LAKTGTFGLIDAGMPRIGRRIVLGKPVPGLEDAAHRPFGASDPGFPRTAPVPKTREAPVSRRFSFCRRRRAAAPGVTCNETK
jgi:hypothetical protein